MNISDPVAILNHLYGLQVLSCLDAADADGNRAVEISDALSLLGFLFLDAAPPVAPFRQCGVDLGDGKLGCEQHAPCG
jgi:hypothetical protein